MDLRDYIDAQRGRAAELARALRISPTLITQWASIRQVPAERCPAIERATGGQVSCEDLRPDVDWAVLRCNCLDESEHNERAPTEDEIQEAA